MCLKILEIIQRFLCYNKYIKYVSKYYTHIGNCETLSCENILTIYFVQSHTCQALQQAPKQKTLGQRPSCFLRSCFHGMKRLFTRIYCQNIQQVYWFRNYLSNNYQKKDTSYFLIYKIILFKDTIFTYDSYRTISRFNLCIIFFSNSLDKISLVKK